MHMQSWLRVRAARRAFGCCAMAGDATPRAQHGFALYDADSRRCPARSVFNCLLGSTSDAPPDVVEPQQLQPQIPTASYARLRPAPPQPVLLFLTSHDGCCYRCHRLVSIDLPTRRRLLGVFDLSPAATYVVDRRPLAPTERFNRAHHHGAHTCSECRGASWSIANRHKLLQVLYRVRPARRLHIDRKAGTL